MLTHRSAFWPRLAHGGALLLLAGASGACDRREMSAAGADAVLTYSIRDTLHSRTGYAVGRPVWISQDAGLRYVVADESDKALKLFDPSGTESASVGRAGSGPGEFLALLGGGALGDSLYSYDFNGSRFSVFSPAGDYVRSFAVAEPGVAMPSTVRVVDDSLLLVVGFPVGAHTRDLVRLLRRDGTPRSTFFNQTAYFTPEDPALIQGTVVHADGAGGVVFVALMGHDSVYAFDYRGRRLGAGALLNERKQSLRTFRSIFEGNGGKRTRPDGSPATQGEVALVALTAMRGGHAVGQLMALDYGPDGQLDRTEGGTFVLLTLDRERGTISSTQHRSLTGGLHGRGRDGAALLVRYLGEDYEQMEVAQLRLAPNAGGGA